MPRISISWVDSPVAVAVEVFVDLLLESIDTQLVEEVSELSVVSEVDTELIE